MKRIIILSSFLPPLALALCGCSSSKSIQSDLANGGFENGELAPWATYLAVQATISSEQAHDGKFSLAEDSGRGSVYQDVKGLQGGVNYTVSAWVYADSGATASAQIAAYDPESNLATFSPVVPPKPAWELVKHTAKVSSVGTLRIHLFRNEGTGKIFWDDVRVSRNQ
jgi:hypothetical protein